MQKELTVGELRKAIEGLPDHLICKISSDTGVDQGEGKIIIEDAYRTKYRVPTHDDKVIEIDYLAIYANDVEV